MKLDRFTNVELVRFGRDLVSRVRKAARAEQWDESRFHNQLAEAGALACLLAFERLAHLRAGLAARWKREVRTMATRPRG
jgi:hypothetical protein